MNIRSLHLLQLIVRTGSFTAAGRAAGISQSAVTQAMKALERTLGATLFIQEGRHRRPSPVALGVVRCVDEFESGMRLLCSEPTTAGADKSLRIGVSPAAALVFGPAIVNAWCSLSQSGRIVMNTVNALDLLRLLRQGELDLVVGPKPRSPARQDLTTRVLYNSKSAIYARWGHPLRRAGTLSEISSVGWVVVGTSDGPGGMIEEAFRVRGLGEPRVAAQCDDYNACLEIIGSSDLMTVIPNPRLVDEFQRTRVFELQIKEGMPRYDVCLFQRAARGGRSLDRAAEAIAHAILEASGHGGPREIRRPAKPP